MGLWDQADYVFSPLHATRMSKWRCSRRQRCLWNCGTRVKQTDVTINRWYAYPHSLLSTPRLKPFGHYIPSLYFVAFVGSSSVVCRAIWPSKWPNSESQIIDDLLTSILIDGVVWLSNVGWICWKNASIIASSWFYLRKQYLKLKSAWSYPVMNRSLLVSIHGSIKSRLVTIPLAVHIFVH